MDEYIQYYWNEYQVKGLVCIMLILLVLPSIIGVTPDSMTGVWIEIEDSNYSNGTALFSNTNGSELLYTFNSSYISLVTQYREDFGIMHVNGGIFKSIDLYHETQVYNVTIPLIENVSGTHTVRITVSGLKNNASAGNYIVVDDFILSNVFEDNQSNVSFFEENLTTDNSSNEIIFDPEPMQIVELANAFGNDGNISFVLPTQNDGFTQTRSNVIINVSIVSSSVSELKFNWNTSNYTVYNDTLVLMFNFDNISSIGDNYNEGANNVSVDVSKYSNNGTLDGVVWTPNGKYGGAFQFNGSNNNSIIVNDSSSLNLSNFTVSAWINADGWKTNYWDNSIVNKDLDGGIGTTAGFFLRSGFNGELSFGIRQDGNGDGDGQDGEDTWPEVRSGPALALGSWYHVVGRYNGSTVTLFINGVENNSALANHFVNSPHALLIGNGYDLAREFNGTIDEVRLWNRTLSNSDIYQEYITNLNKFNSTQWFLYVNQSKNATLALEDGNYTYFASASDVSNNANKTETRTITVDSANHQWANNGTNLTANTSLGGFVYFNITLNATNPGKYIFAFNNGTEWINDTAQVFTNEQDILVTKQINSSPIIWRWYFNDTNGNTQTSDEWTVTLDSGISIIRLFPQFATNISQFNTYDITYNVSCTGPFPCGEVNITLTSDNSYIFDDFDTGSFGGDYWTTYSSSAGNGRVAVSNTAAYSGNYSVIMDSTDGNANLNELITNFDFSGSSYIFIDFFWMEAPTGDTLDTGIDHATHHNSDAVYYTCDGTNWYHLVNAPNDFTSWAHTQINVTADSDFCSTINQSFKIKFTQYDNSAWPNDGIVFDSIKIITSAGDGGIISTNTTAGPFFANGSNPVNMTLGFNESQLVSFRINATGVVGERFSLFAHANRTQHLSESNQTSGVNFTIVERDILFPVWFNNDTNLTSSTALNSNVSFNITVNESNPDKIIFAFYNSTTWVNDTARNYSNAVQTLVYKNITASPIKWTWYFNDTSGNSNQSDVFTQVLQTPVGLDLIYPLTSINVTQNFTFNVTVNVTCPGPLDCGGVNVSLDPNTDRTPRTCTGAWGASCHGIDPQLGDYSFDSCATGSYYTGGGFLVDEVYVDATTVAIGDTVNITCAFDCYSSSNLNDLAISYYNGSWYQVWSQDAACIDGNYSKAIVVSGNLGTQWARCQIGYTVNNPVGTCFNTALADNDDVNFTVVELKKTGLINTTIGAIPFFTNQTANPYNITLNAGDFQEITFLVNATGESGISHDFFVFVNRTDLMTNGNTSAHWNVTILPSKNPLWKSNGTNLTTTTNLDDIVYFNITLSDHSPNRYIFGFYNGTHWANDTALPYTDEVPITVTKNITSSPIYWTWYFNDTEGNTNQSDVWTVVLGSAIGIEFIYPTQNINVTQNELFNVTVNVSCPSNVPCREVNVSLDPTPILLISDNFENGEGAWTHGGTNDLWALGTPSSGLTSAFSGTNAWGTKLNGNYVNNMDSWLRSETFNLVGYSDANLTFMHWYSTEACCDGGIVEASIDGTTWKVVQPDGGYPSTGYSGFARDFAGSSGGWKKVHMNISEYVGNGSVSIRYRFGTDGSVVNSGWFIDDVNVTGFKDTKGGLVSTTVNATPFYTNTTNPYNISLDAWESQAVTFYVNATGDGNVEYEFFVYANKTSGLNSNSTVTWNITTLDLTIPQIIYIDPSSSSGTFSRNWIDGNFSSEDSHLSSITIKIFNTTGLVSSSSAVSSPHYKNFTNLTDGIYYLNATALDSANNSNFTQTRVITLDYTAPPFTYHVPTPKNDTRQPQEYFTINMSMAEGNLKELIYEWNRTNYSLYNESLVIMMNMDNRSSIGDNATYAVDVSMHGNNATISGPIWNISGRYDRSLVFDGVDDFLNISKGVNAKGSSFTVALWVYLDNNTIYTTEKVLLEYGSWQSGSYHLTSLNNSHFRLNFFGSSSSRGSDCSRYELNDSSWHHLAGVFDSNANLISTYFDGSICNSTVETNNPADVSGLDIYIGSRNGTENFFNGSLDELRLWNRSLTEYEVYLQYASNLKKAGNASWFFYVNQSNNASTNLTQGNYTYGFFARDSLLNSNYTGLRTIIIDWTRPSFHNLTNQTIEHYYGLSYYINASDENGLGCFTVNDTVNFQINCSGFLRNNTLLQNNLYHVNISFNDSAGNLLSENIFVNVTDTIPPAFTTIDNRSSEYGNRFTYQIAARDSNNVSCFTVNDTANFQINCTGYLENNTNLSIAIHWLNISVNDTFGNFNSTLIYVNVSDTRQPSLNITSPANNTYTSDTGVAIIYNVSDPNLESCWYSNDTYLQNVTIPGCGSLSTVTWSELTHNFTLWANDSYGNTNRSSIVFTIDTIAPVFTNITNFTIFEEDAFFYDINVTDVNPISCFTVNDTTNFNINCTGYLQNNTSFNQTHVGLHWLNITVNDSANNKRSQLIFVNITDKGRISMDLVYPLGDINVTQHEFYNVSINVSCRDHDCGDINVSLKENFGTIRNSFFDGFEDVNLTSNWVAIGDPGTNNRITVATSTSACGSPRTGSYFITFDTNGAGTAETNILKTAFDFTGVSDIILDFWHHETGDEETACADHNGNDPNCDGFFYSCNGIRWFSLGNFPSVNAWTNVYVNVSADSDFCPEVNSSFAIKFTQFDEYSCTTDGRVLDDINISYINTTQTVMSRTNGITPFYTNTTNPFNITLNQSDFALITWYVNASGSANTTHELIVFSSRVTDATIENTSIAWNTTIQDITPPFISGIHNVTIEFANSLFFDINATDINGIFCFSVNDSSFSINCTGALINNTLLSVNIYNLNITANDTYSNIRSDVMMVNVTNTTFPQFTNLENQIYSYAYPISYDIDATDMSGISCFTINYTSNFTIDCNGVFQNSSIVDQGGYWINITVNDTLGNKNSSLFFVNITGQDVVVPDIVIDYPANATLFNYTVTSIELNVSSSENVTCFYSLDGGVINTTMSNNASSTGFNDSIPVVAGTSYLANVYCKDTQNNWNRSEYVYFTIDAPVITIDILYPLSSINVSSRDVFNITANVTCTRINCGAINVTVDNITGSLFSTNTTNPSNISLNANQSAVVVFWLNATGALNTRQEMLVFANTTAFDLNITGKASTFNVTILDLTNPHLAFTPSSFANGSYNLGKNFSVNISVSDLYLDAYSINVYNSTGLMNSTQSTFIQLLNLSFGVYYYNATANDTSGNSNSTATRTIDLTSPTLGIFTVFPTGDSNVTQNQFFNVTINLTCIGYDCGSLNLTLDPAGSIECGSISNCDFSQAGSCTGADGTCTDIPGWTYEEITDGTFERAQVSTTANPFGSKGNWLEFRSTYGGSGNTLWKAYIYSNAFIAVADYITYSFKGVDYDEWGYGLMIYEEGNESGNFQLLESRCPFTGSWSSSDDVWGGCDDNTIFTPNPFIDKTVAIQSSLQNKNIRIKVWTGDGGTGDYGEASLDDICLSYANGVCFSSVKSIIPTAVGKLPFYTNHSDNPFPMNMNKSDSQLVSFFVNASGRINTTYEFFAYAIIDDEQSIRNDTSPWNVTILDLTAPIVNFVPPSTQTGFLNHTQIKVNITATDAYYSNLSVYLFNATSLINTTHTTANNLYIVFNNLSDEVYFINASAMDTNGNTGYSTTRNVTLDNIIPGLSITAPVNHFNSSSQDVNFTFVVSDNLTSSCVIYRDQDGNVNYLNAGNNTSVTPEVNTTINVSALPSRVYQWYLDCTDQAGNNNVTAIRTLTVDADPPAITITAPTDNGTFGYTIFVKTEIADALSPIDYASYSIYNNTNVSQSVANGTLNLSGGWDVTWDSSIYPGISWDMLLVVTANDTLGNTQSKNVTFTLDNAQPSIQLITPTTFLQYFNSDFNLSSIIQDNSFNYTDYNITQSLVVIQSNKTTFSPSRINFTWEELVNVSGKTDGTFNYTVYAQDDAGNTISKSTLFIIDTAPADITIHYPLTGSYINTSSVTFNWTATENISTEVSCSLNVSNTLNSLFCNNASFCNLSLGGFTQGPYNFSVKCTDNATNVNLVESNFSVDTEFPAIAYVDTTTVEGNLSQNYISVNISAFDFHRDTVIIRLMNSSFGIINETTNKSNILTLNFTSLAEGTYYFNASVNDSFGDVNATALRKVILDNSIPNISVAANDTVLEYLEDVILLNWSVTDNNIKSLIFNVTTSAKFLIYNSTESNGSIVLNGTDLISIGTYTVTLFAIDIAGNNNITNLTFSVDDTKTPSADVDEPAAGNYSQNWIYVNASSDDNAVSQLKVFLTNTTQLLNESIGAVNPYTINFTNLPDGVYFVNLTACDDTRCNSSSTFRIELDATTPLLSLLPSTPNTDSYLSSNAIPINMSGSDSHLDSLIVRLFNSSGILINTSIGLSSPFFISIGSLADGAYFFNATVNDTFGNTNNSLLRNTTIDTVFPSINFSAGMVDNNTFATKNYIFVNITVNDSNEANVTFKLFNQSNALINSTTLSPAQRSLNFTGLADGLYTFNTTIIDLAGNTNTTDTHINILDTTDPITTQVTPLAHAYNSTTRSILFYCSATDGYQLANLSLYITNASNQSMALNQTFGISGTSAISLWNLTLLDGNYTWRCLSEDSSGKSNWSGNRTILINFSLMLDLDNDGIEDDIDFLEFNESNVSKFGFRSDLNITVGGNATKYRYQTVEDVKFYEGTFLMLNFTHNFSKSRLNLLNVSIRKASNSIILNFSSQLQENKSVYIEDNDFIALCAKDAEIESITEISEGCNGANETDLTACLGGSYKSNGLSCTDLGSTLQINHMAFSAVRGTPAPSTSPSSSTGGGGGGGGGGGAAIPRACIWNCTDWEPCFDSLNQRVCTSDNYYCTQTKKDRPVQKKRCDEQDSIESITGNTIISHENIPIYKESETFQEINREKTSEQPSSIPQKQTSFPTGVVLMFVFIIILVCAMYYLKKDLEYLFSP